VADDAEFTAHPAHIAELALRNRLPTIFGLKEIVEAGGLMAMGPISENSIGVRRAMCTRSCRVLIPRPSVEQPTKFELAINMKTVKTLGLNTPPTLLVRADEVIE
jgi:putative tryptophan/tyrosine transport system substrate-binding protein